MIEALDSRTRPFTDCYRLRFMKAGVYRYYLLPMDGECLTEERPFTVTVVERTGAPRMTQHEVVVRSAANRFVAEPRDVKIQTGDCVLWSCPDPSALPYRVAGEKGFFNSHRSY